MKHFFNIGLLIAYAAHIFAGGVCCGEATKVNIVKRHYSMSNATMNGGVDVEQQARDIRNKQIIDAVESMPLMAIYTMHTKFIRPEVFGLETNTDERKMFNAAIAARYEDNKDVIDLMVAKQEEHSRQLALRANARMRMSMRRRRLAWRSEDTYRHGSSGKSEEHIG